MKDKLWCSQSLPICFFCLPMFLINDKCDKLLFLALSTRPFFPWDFERLPRLVRPSSWFPSSRFEQFWGINCQYMRVLCSRTWWIGDKYVINRDKYLIKQIKHGPLFCEVTTFWGNLRPTKLEQHGWKVRANDLWSFHFTLAKCLPWKLKHHFLKHF